MRALGDFVRFGGLFTFALCLARCSGTSETEQEGGDAGDAGEGASGGSVAASGGSSGAAGKGGSGGSAGTVSAGRGGNGGTAGSAGAAGSIAAGRGGDGGTAGTIPGKNGGQGGSGGTPTGGTAGVPGAGEGGETSGEAGAGGSDDGGGGESPESGGAGGVSEPPRLEGDVCSTALTLSATASGSTSEFTNDHNNVSCFGWALAGADVAYSFSIPPLTRYTIVADPSDAYDLALYAISPPAENCTAVPTCAYGADQAIDGVNETMVIDNYESEWRSYYLMVDGFVSMVGNGNGTYDLTATSAPIPAGEVCETATPLTVGEPISATLDGFGADYSGRPVCTTANAQGPDAVYSVSVPAGNTLTIVATPAGNMDIALYIFDAATPSQCRTPTACLAAADEGFGADAETLTYANTGATRTVFVHVDRFDPGTQLGDYTLMATIAPTP